MFIIWNAIRIKRSILISLVRRIWRYYPRGISFGNMAAQSTENVLVKEIDTYLSKILPVQQRVIKISDQLVSNEQENWKKIDLLERNDGIREIQNTQPQINDYVQEVTTISSITTSEAMIWDEPQLSTSASIFGWYKLFEIITLEK